MTIQDLVRVKGMTDIVHEDTLKDIQSVLGLMAYKFSEEDSVKLNEEELLEFTSHYTSCRFSYKSGRYYAHRYRNLGYTYSDVFSPVPRSNISNARINGPSYPLWGSKDYAWTQREIRNCLQALHSVFDLSGILPIGKLVFEANADSLFEASGSYLYFTEEYLAPESRGHSWFFKSELPTFAGSERLPLTVDGVENAAALYTRERQAFILLPFKFHKIFEGCSTTRQYRARLRKLLGALASALATVLLSGDRLKDKAVKDITEATTRYYDIALAGKAAAVEQALSSRDLYKARYMTEYQKHIKESMEYEGLLRGKESVKDKLASNLGEIEELLNSPFVKNIRYDRSRLSLKINTTFLFFVNPNTRVVHQLGEIEITINLQDFSFTFDNKSMKFQGGFSHPHVNSGRPCLGNFGAGLLDLMLEGRINTLVTMLITFLQSCNPRDEWGKNCVYWPVEDESKADPSWESIKISLNTGYLMKKVAVPESSAAPSFMLDAYTPEEDEEYPEEDEHVEEE